MTLASVARSQGTLARHALLSDKGEEMRHGSRRISPHGCRVPCLMGINVCTFIATNPAHSLGNLQVARRQADTMLEKFGATYLHVGKAKRCIFTMSNRADIALLERSFLNHAP